MIDKKRTFMDAQQQAFFSVQKEVETVKRMVDSYTRSATEFTEEKKYEYLNREQMNLCKFHIAAEDLTLIMPNKSLDINKMRAEVTKNRNIGSAQNTFTSNDFFINKN